MKRTYKFSLAGIKAKSFNHHQDAGGESGGYTVMVKLSSPTVYTDVAPSYRRAQYEKMKSLDKLYYS